MRATRARTPRALAAFAVARGLPFGFLAFVLGGCGPADPAGLDLAPARTPERIEQPHARAASAPINLVMVSLDTLRADRLGAYGHERPTSPHLDRLAAEGILFENAFSASPKTAPSHMTLMTGLHPETHRVMNRFAGSRLWEGRLSPDVPTLAEILAAAGYHGVARTGGGNLHGDAGFARGFVSFEDPKWVKARGLFKIAIEELRALAGAPAPFFLFVHTYQIHAPYLPPKRYRQQFVDPAYAGGIVNPDAPAAGAKDAPYLNFHKRFWEGVDKESAADRSHLLDLYDANIRYTDEQLGDLLDEIEAQGIADRTIVVVLSDHGEEFGEHGGFEHDALWQELLHVPLVLRVPAALRTGWQGRRIAAPVGLVDVLPTLLELLGLPVPGHLQGRSLVPLVEKDADGPPWVFAQHRERGEVALLASGWKLLRRRGDDLLFDLSTDPDEQDDRGAGSATVRDAAARHVDQVLDASRAYWPLVSEAEAIPVDDETRRQLEALGYVGDEETGAR